MHSGLKELRKPENRITLSTATRRAISEGMDRVGLTTTALAAAVGVSETSIRRIVNKNTYRAQKTISKELYENMLRAVKIAPKADKANTDAPARGSSWKGGLKKGQPRPDSIDLTEQHRTVLSEAYLACDSQITVLSDKTGVSSYTLKKVLEGDTNRILKTTWHKIKSALLSDEQTRRQTSGLTSLEEKFDNACKQAIDAYLELEKFKMMQSFEQRKPELIKEALSKVFNKV